MFARIVNHTPRPQKKDKFLKLHAAGGRMTQDEEMLKWARELALILFAVLIVLVISIAGK